MTKCDDPYELLFFSDNQSNKYRNQVLLGRFLDSAIVGELDELLTDALQRVRECSVAERFDGTLDPL